MVIPGLSSFSRSCLALLLFSIWISLCASYPTVILNWEVHYRTVSPLGVNQQVIAVDGMFPGPILNVTTNFNVVVNIINSLDEPLLITWNGIQMKRNSGQDGVLGTNCPIPVNWNYTYEFQVEDQIGSFFYSPSTHFQRASGGFGGIILNDEAVVSLPFDEPYGDITMLIGDWYISNHKSLRRSLNHGNDLGMPDGVLINGKGPYRYSSTLVPDGIDYETFKVEPGKTYRLRVHNVGISTSLNFRIQNHNLLLVETEGEYTVRRNYTSLDIHVGQSYSFLVTMDQDASSDYYVVASPRFVNETAWQRVTGVGILHYSNSKGKAAGPLPLGPQDENDKTWSMNQARSIRWNISPSDAQPNSQGSFKHVSVDVDQLYVVKNKPPVMIKGKRRTTLNGISYVNADTPLRLADEYGVKGVYTLDFPEKPLTSASRMATSVINGTYLGIMEIVLQNNDTKVQSYHLDGYAFYVMGMGYGDWNRSTYYKWDGIVRRSTTQVFPGGWTSILIPLVNVGFWNLRTVNLDSHYLGQETYIRIVNPEAAYEDGPQSTIYCGALEYMHHQGVPSIAPVSADLSSITVLLICFYCFHLLSFIFID